MAFGDEIIHILWNFTSNFIKDLINKFMRKFDMLSRVLKVEFYEKTVQSSQTLLRFVGSEIRFLIYSSVMWKNLKLRK